MTSKTIALSGAEEKIIYSGGTNAWLRNDSMSTVYASGTPEIVAGADGVVAILAGQSAPVYGANGTVYLLGTGSVQLIGSDYASSPFKTSTSSGGSSGVDEQARAAIEAHAGDSEIHVTAAEKAGWDGKAELSDIPAALPANGGNADTVDGKHAREFLQFMGNLNSGSLLDHVLTMTSSGWIIAAMDATDTPVAGQFFWVEVRRNNAGDYCITATRMNGTGVYTNRYNVGTKKWYGWANAADGGNAASVGTYTEAKLAALEARVAALETK